MFVEESTFIHAGMDRVWGTFTDVTCWKDWSKALLSLPEEETEEITEGARLKFCIRPFSLPITFEPEELGKGVRLTSRETFTGLPLLLAGFLFPKSRIRELTLSLLRDLKNAVESGQAGKT